MTSIRFSEVFVIEKSRFVFLNKEISESKLSN